MVVSVRTDIPVYNRRAAVLCADDDRLGLIAVSGNGEAVVLAVC